MPDNIEELVNLLYAGDNNIACGAFKALQAASEDNCGVYPYLDVFVSMFSGGSSYVRTRGLVLFAANAKWDADDKVNANIAEYLEHITDKKPITSRQCIKSLPLIAKSKPELKADIIAALQNADISIYADSMQPLVFKDIREALAAIQ